MARLIVAAAVLGASACVPASVRPEAASPLVVHEVAWNPQHVDVGRVDAVVEQGDLLVLFGDKGALVLAGGALVAVDPSVTAWRGAGTMPAPDGAGTWIVGVDGKGTLHRLKARSTLEPVSARFGLAGVPVRGLATTNHTHAFLLDGAFAVRQGAEVVRFDGPWRALAGGGDVLSALFDGGVRVAGASDHTFAVEGARLLAVDGRGHTFVATDRALYGEDGAALRLRYVGERIDALAAVADGVWAADGPTLVRLDAAGLSRGGTVSPGARLVAAPGGDVWVLGGASPVRLSTGREAWPSAVYARVCAKCHGPNGSAGVDLSSEAAWKARRAAVRKRVIEAQDMPPAGTPLSAEDKAAIEAFTR